MYVTDIISHQLVNIGFLKLWTKTNILIYVDKWRTAGWTILKTK